MSHNVLKAHGRAVQMLREYAPDAQVGFAPTCGIPYPASDKAEDVEAARQVMFSVPESDNWTWNVPWWSDPVLLGHYPEEALRRFHKELPNITKEDLKLILEPIDIYGQNIYNGWMVKMGDDGKIYDAGHIDFEERYLAQLNRVIQDGADIRGSF